MTGTQRALALGNTPSTFNFGDYAVRVVLRDGEPWFVATDICRALDYSNPSKAVADHLDDDERSHEQLDRSRMGSKAVIINESGLYALVLRSRKPEARKFAKWVTREVLPSIRKTGVYGIPNLPPIDPRKLMLSGATTPTVSLPAEIEDEISKKAWNMAREAYELSREHLKRRAAYEGEYGYPVRKLNREKALDAIHETDLGRALTHLWHQQVGPIDAVIRTKVGFVMEMSHCLEILDSVRPKMTP